LREEAMDIFELEILKCPDCGMQFDVSQVTCWSCPVCGNGVWIIAEIDEKQYVLQRVRARDLEKEAVVLLDGTHDAYEVKKTQKSAGSVEIHLKNFDILNVKEGDFVNTIIGNWKPGVDGRPSVEMPSEKEKAVTE